MQTKLPGGDYKLATNCISRDCDVRFKAIPIGYQMWKIEKPGEKTLFTHRAERNGAGYNQKGAGY